MNNILYKITFIILTLKYIQYFYKLAFKRLIIFTFYIEWIIYINDRIKKIILSLNNKEIIKLLLMKIYKKLRNNLTLERFN